MQYLTELLAFFVAQHGHRAQFFILSNPVSMRIASLLYMKQKPLRHGKSNKLKVLTSAKRDLAASLRYFRACLKASSHFIHRHLIKYELLLPMLELLESESPRDNMLSSACLDIFEIIRKVRCHSSVDSVSTLLTVFT
jgi:protein phosphatase-4 regulatory subunit 3